MMDAAPREQLVLVIDDEAPIRRFLRATLTANGYQVNEAGTARDGLIQAGMRPPDLVILDLGLPDEDGFEVLKNLRGWLRVPIIVLSARGQEQDKVNALDLGADDYLTKPFGVGELLARLRVASRHASEITGAGGEQIYECTQNGRTLHVDLARRIARIKDHAEETDLRLTATEFKLLALLVKHAGRVLTHKQILTAVWGPSHSTDVQYLRVYAGQLRQKIEAEPAQPRFLITEPGVGYRLAESNR